jgi:nucleoside-diphosphate-sugar epimerase
MAGIAVSAVWGGGRQMKVLVTGGTGFVGSHSVAALVSRGHQVRLLVRSRDRVARSLSPLGVEDVESVVGDVTVPQSVEEAMAGCDAVLHAASVYSLDPRAASRVRETNLRGTETVLGAAVRRGLDPVVHVSSYVALLPPEPRGAVLTPDSPVTRPAGAYCLSKAESEQAARRYQDQGAPVAIVYPGGVIGPDDPYLGDSNRNLAEFAKSGRAMRGGSPMPGRLPFSHEGIWISALQPHCDDSRTAAELGITARDLRETLTDTVRWLTARGHLPAAQA